MEYLQVPWQGPRWVLQSRGRVGGRQPTSLGIKAVLRLWTRMVQLSTISNVCTLSWEQIKFCNYVGSLLSGLGNSLYYRKGRGVQQQFLSGNGKDVLALETSAHSRSETAVSGFQRGWGVFQLNNRNKL